MAENGDHKHGTMDTTAHERTFAGFIQFTKVVVIVVVSILVVLAIFRT
jgi:hypothetical protein